MRKPQPETRILHFLRFRNLQQQLGFYAFILSLVTMIGVTVSTYMVARKKVLEQQQRLAGNMAYEFARDLQGQLENAVDGIEFWAHMQFLHDALEQRRVRELEAFFNDLMDHNSEYDLIAVIGYPDEKIVALSTVLHPRLPLDKLGPVDPRQYVGRPYRNLFQDEGFFSLQEIVSAGAVKGTGWRSLEPVNNLYGRIGDEAPVEQRFQIVLAIPVGKPALGVLVTVLNWSHFQRVLDRAAEEFQLTTLPLGYAYLLASDCNTIIGHKLRDLKRYGINRYGTPVESPKVREECKSAATLPSDRVTTTLPVFDYEYQGKKKWAAVVKLDPPKLGAQFEWRLGVGVYESEILAPVKDLRRLFLYISTVVTLFVLLLTLLLGRRLSISLKQITESVRAATRGGLPQLASRHTDDEVGELAEALKEWLAELRKGKDFRPIPNPYVVGNPVRIPEVFFGRQEDLKWIADQLERPGNEMILLHGPRRIGKTSLLHRIASETGVTKALPFFLDTQQIIPELEKGNDFYRVLAREILRQLPGVLPGVRAPFPAAECHSPEGVRNLLRFLHDTEPGKVPVLLVDEIQNLELKSLSPDVLMFLGSLLDGEIPVSFVATGGDPEQLLRSPYWKPLTPKILRRQIGLLTRGDALRLITEPASAYLLYDDDIPERILRLTAGHPYYTQAICQQMVDYANQKREVLVRSEEFHAILDELLENSPVPLHYAWEAFASIEKIAAAGLAQGLADDQEYLPPEVVLAGLPSELRPKARDGFHSALDRLRRLDWLENDHEGKYRFKIDLLRHWIRREHSVFLLTDELELQSTS